MAKKNVVIIGAGTAGLVIANNLQDYFNVTILEKSKYKSYPFIFRIPMLIGLLFRKKLQKYITNTDFPLSSGRKIPFFESQVLGGASVINGCVHTIGMRSAWEEILKNYNLDYQDLERSVAKNYSNNFDVPYKINLTLAKSTLIDEVFKDTLNKLDIPCGDMNYSNEPNCGQIYNTSGKIFRTSVLSLLRSRKFSVRLNQSVEKLQFDGEGKILGVVVDNNIVSADYVILSAGVLGTNKLLLSEANKEIFKPAVFEKIGLDIQDHVNLRINVFTSERIGSFNEIEKSWIKKFNTIFSHLLCKPNLLRGTGATSGVHLDLDGDGRVDTRIQVVQFTETGRHGSDGKYFGSNPGFSLSITPINPHSKGKIKKLGDSFIIEPGYLIDRHDMVLLVKALNFCINLLKTSPLCDYVKEIVGLKEMQINPEKYIEDNIFSGHHLIGGAQNIVTSNFLVEGFENLYICDASIFSGYAASNIHSSVVLMADIFSTRFISENK